MRAVCNSSMLDSGAFHASSCVKIRTKRGPYKVADLVHEGAKACDPTVETEVLGLVPGIDLHPEDVLTSALSSHFIALDVSVSPPDRNPHVHRDGDQQLFGKNSLVGSKIHHKTELSTQ